MYGGPSYGGLRRETGLPLAPGRCRWATWSTTPADSPESGESATTTCWDRRASTSSPEAPTWWRGYRSPPARCGGSLPWPRSYNSRMAPSRHSSSKWGWAGSRTPRTPSGSSRCDGATVGVQRPSSDPYIEPVDATELSGVTQEVLAVVERARAKWEDAPRHPAHERPATPARRRPRREQSSAQDSTAEEEAAQQEPETLRLF